MKTFEFTFKDEKVKIYKQIILLFVILHALFFLYLIMSKELWKEGVAGLALIVLYSGYKLLISNAQNRKFIFGEGIFFLFGMFFIFINLWWWLILLQVIISTFCLFLLHRRSIYFTSYIIEHKKYPHKRYQWNAFNNVILKDNILTLDFKSNKLLQGEVASTNINEVAFNTFAKEQLAKHN